MAQEPLLRMAISRGPQVNVSELQEEVGRGAEKLKTAYESQREVDDRETELKGLSHCKL